MVMREFSGLESIGESVGEVIGPTEWVMIDQELIDRFAEDTGDFNWVHVDSELANKSSFGSTIAHGFLTLSLIGKFSPELILITDYPTTINYGLNRVRFPAPCPAGSRIRATAEIISIDQVQDGGELVLKYVFEREGSAKPICVAEQVSRRVK